MDECGRADSRNEESEADRPEQDVAPDWVLSAVGGMDWSLLDGAVLHLETGPARIEAFDVNDEGRPIRMTIRDLPAGERDRLVSVKIFEMPILHALTPAKRHAPAYWALRAADEEEARQQALRQERLLTRLREENSKRQQELAASRRQAMARAEAERRARNDARSFDLMLVSLDRVLFGRRASRSGWFQREERIPIDACGRAVRDLQEIYTSASSNS